MVKIEKFEVFDSGVSGRGIRSTLNIAAGVEILKETPLVKTLTNAKHRGVRCDYCFSDPEKLFKCSKCKFVWYCGKNCQSSDWKIHKQECKCLIKVAPKQPPDICRLVSHLLFKYYSQCKKSTNTTAADDDADVSEIENLIENRDSISSARREAFFTFGAVLHDYLEDCLFTNVDIYGLICRVSCNSFTITNSELNSLGTVEGGVQAHYMLVSDLIKDFSTNVVVYLRTTYSSMLLLGTGLYKNASLINHSCNPNCVAIFEGTTLSIRTIRDVECGEEFLMSYVNLLETTDVRLMELNEGYMFNCTCEICLGKGLNDFLMKSFKCSRCASCLQTMHTTEKICSCSKNCDPDEERLTEATKCMDELEALYHEINIIPSAAQQVKVQENIRKAESILGPHNLALMHSYEVAMDGCLGINDWKGALELSRKLEKIYPIYLTKYHPSIGLHYFKQGKLENHLGNLREGISYLQKAMKVLSISHGEQHNLVILLKEQLDGACYEMAQREEYEAIERIYKQEE